MKIPIILVTLILLGIGMTSLVNAAYIFTDLGTLSGNNSTATAINNAGQVVGYSYATLDDSHATLWNGTTLTALDTTMGGYYSQATAINNAGDRCN
jgi:probable HAF family extracellular repeat protein